MLWFHFFLLLFHPCAAVIPSAQKNHPESSLLRRLLKDYDPQVRPLLHPNTTITVHLRFTPIRIDDLDLRREELKITGWMAMAWTDEFLRWEPQKESGVESLFFLKEDIWVPTVNIINSLRGIFPSHEQFYSTKVHVAYTGASRYVLPDNFALSCDVNIQCFPFDKQTCTLRFSSWYHPVSQLLLTSEKRDMDQSQYEEDGEWELQRTDVIVTSHTYFVDPFKENAVNFSEVSFSLSVVRRPTYYIINVLIPCLMLCVLVLCNFFLPPDSGEKVSLGITVLLAFTVFQLLIAELIPTSSVGTPVLASYLICIMALSTSSVVMSVFVLNLHYRGVYSHPPRWLQHLVLYHLARAMRMDCGHVTRRVRPMADGKDCTRTDGNKIMLTVQEEEDSGAFPKITVSDHRLSNHHARQCDSDCLHTFDAGSEKQSLRDTMGLHTGETCMVGELRQTVSCERELTSYRTATLNPESGHTLIPLGSKSTVRLIQSINNLNRASGERNQDQCHQEFISAVQDVYHELQTSRHAGELEHALVNEWKLIARVVDRFFFWVTFVSLLLTTVGIFAFALL